MLVADLNREVGYDQLKDNFGMSIDVDSMYKDVEGAFGLVDGFPYLGSIISQDCSLDAEIATRIEKATKTFAALNKVVFRNKRHRVQLSTKVHVFRTIVLAVLLYACETWTLYSKHYDLLERFQMSCLRQIVGIGRKRQWDGRISNEQIRAKCNLPSIRTTIERRRLVWVGKLGRMPDERLPRRVLFSTFRTHPEVVWNRWLHGGGKQWIEDAHRDLENRNLAVRWSALRAGKGSRRYISEKAWKSLVNAV